MARQLYVLEEKAHNLSIALSDQVEVRSFLGGQRDFGSLYYSRESKFQEFLGPAE